MAHCKPEEWTLKELAKALDNKVHENKKIVIPMFQRRQCWDAKKEADFVDSLRRGFPVGAMLFYKTVVDDAEVYTLIDGLQRSNTVRKYMNRPTKFFRSDSLPDTMLEDILKTLRINENTDVVKQTASNAACAYLRELDKLDGIEKYEMAKAIIRECGADPKDVDLNEAVQKIIAPYANHIKEEFTEIEKIVVPILVYTGEVSNLPEIFERINSKGVALNDYEVFSAAWPVKRFRVDNEKIVYKIMDKYDSLVNAGYSIEGYDGNAMRTGKELSAFEYLFGLSRVLNESYSFLHFYNKSTPDEINPLAYELVNTCLNDSKDDIPTLYEKIYSLDVNTFEKCLLEAVNYVGSVIEPITKFKGNKRKKNTIFHSKYQIISLIAYVFRKMYDPEDMEKRKDSWSEQDILIKKYMPQHYVYDIITRAWYDGGQSKSYKWAKDTKYSSEISYPVWNSALNMYFENSNTKKETTKVTNPSKEDIVLLNCIHLSLFTAKDQLGEQAFDIEHLATKQRMAELISGSQGSGLPIGSIANICYLQEGINRAKGKLTIYQYEQVAGKLDDIEKRFSFTCREDLAWIEKNQKKFDVLKNDYFSFLRKRFEGQKKAFYSTMGITVPDKQGDVMPVVENQIITVSENVPDLPDSSYKVGRFVKQAMRNLSDAEYVFSDNMLKEMCTLEWSRETFGKRFWLPLLVPEDQLVKRERYYKEIFTYNGRNYYLYSQWEINSDMRERFIQWYRQLP